MAFTGRLGTDDSQFGNLLLGSDGEGGFEASFTADAVLQASVSDSFTADAVLSAAQSASFTVDASIALQGTASFTADAILSASLTGSLSANAVLSAGQSSSFTADAEIVATLQQFTVDAVLAAVVSASFTADAEIIGPTESSFTADAVIAAKTRFYLNSTTNAGVGISPAFEAGWEGTALVPRRRMGNPSIAVSTKISTSGNAAGTSGTFDRLSGQFISEPLIAATVIAGFEGLLRVSENNAAADMRAQAVLKVVSGDGNTLRGIVTNFNAGALADEWPTTQASRTFPFSGSTNTPVAALVGDRIVVEVGFRLHNNSGSSFTGVVRWGYAVGGADFTAVGETTDLNPWLDIIATTRLLPNETSFTANAWLQGTVEDSFAADAVIEEIGRSRHSRTGPQHEGVDNDAVHLIAWAFDRYQRGQDLHEVLVDLDARLTAMESGFAVSQLNAFLAQSVILNSGMSQSLTADAHLQQPDMTFAANSFIQPSFFADAWVSDPGSGLAIMDDVMAAQTWTLTSSPQMAIISSSSLTWDAVNDPDWWYGSGEAYLSGWVKFTVATDTVVHIDTINGGGDMVIEVWSGGGPGTWAGEEPFTYADENVDDPTNPYGFSEEIEETFPAGTYWVLVHPYEESPPTPFFCLLRMYLP